MEEAPSSPSQLERKDSETKELYPHTIISSPESVFTLDHKRVIKEDGKIIYSVRFEPDESKTIAVGYSDGTIGIIRVSNGSKLHTLGAGASTEEHRPIGCMRYIEIQHIDIK